MDRSTAELRTGDWVQVKSPAEIAQTLDAEGTVDGLPFMPEMLEFCGKTFPVTRRVEKLCVEFPGGSYKIREFRQNDVVVLQDLRCSGSDHEGCQRACRLFWKAAWLRKVDPGNRGAADSTGLRELTSKLRTVTSTSRHFCQSSAAANATQSFSRAQIFVKCLREIRSGSRGVFEMARLIAVPLWRKATHWFPRRRISGALRKTPVGSLGLQPGEWVQIKSLPDITNTLDHRGRNRGLICDEGMCRYSGGRYRVRNRLDRMISEPTGEMRRVEGTVILEGLECLCWNATGGCPRGEFMYWREVWLERCDPGGTEAERSAGARETWVAPGAGGSDQIPAFKEQENVPHERA
jgi:hypothetical protein